MESTLNIRVSLNQGANFSLKKTVCHLVSKNDLPHVNIFLIQSIVELNALQFISSFFSLMNKSIPFSNVTDLSWKIFKFFLSDFFVLGEKIFAILQRGI